MIHGKNNLNKMISINGMERIKLEGLNPEEEFIVKWQFRMLGDFKTALIKCIMQADDKNLARLECGFPDEVRGYLDYTRIPGWWEKVKKKANIDWE